MLGILFFAKAHFQRYRNSCLVVPSHSQIHVCVYVYDPPFCRTSLMCASQALLLWLVKIAGCLWRLSSAKNFLSQMCILSCMVSPATNRTIVNVCLFHSSPQQQDERKIRVSKRSKEGSAFFSSWVRKHMEAHLLVTPKMAHLCCCLQWKIADDRSKMQQIYAVCSCKNLQLNARLSVFSFGK